MLSVMPEHGSISERLQKLRERAGLTVEDLAARVDVSPFHVEIPDEEFTCEYSPADARRFCQVLNAPPRELFGVSSTESPVSASDLVQCIGAECRKRGVSLQQFEDAVGWRLGQCMSPPERLFEDMSLDGLQWLCRELGIHWHRVILAL
jgi:transcriptional regulator with XRE-family HTH domain